MTTHPGDPGYKVDRLRGALCTDPDHVRLYQDSPTFHHTIEMLARLLPAMIDGFAAQAIQADLERAQAEQLLARQALDLIEARRQLGLDDPPTGHIDQSGEGRPLGVTREDPAK